MGKIKRVAGDEHELIVGIELIARVAIVAVEPQTIIIALDIEQVQIAVRIRMYKASSKPLPLE